MTSNVKLLVLSNIKDFDEKKVLEELNELKRQHFDVVVVIGDISQILLRETSLLFETSLITVLPNEDYYYQLYKDFGIVDLNHLRFRIDKEHIYGYGNCRYNRNRCYPYRYEGNDAEIIISYHNPLEYDNNASKDVKEYIKRIKPTYLIHGDCCENNTSIIDNTTSISCYGIVPLELEFATEVVE